jgi:transketolase
MKWTFQLALYERAKADDRIFLIFGDVGAVLFKKFRADFPRRCFNAGICEQSMVSMAAGMAMEGFRPVVYTITPFLIERAFEQIKLDVDQMNQPVGLVGYCDNEAGPTHITRQEGALAAHWENIRYYRASSKEKIPELVAGIDIDRPWFLSLKPLMPYER